MSPWISAETSLPRASLATLGTKASMTNTPPALKCRATVPKHRVCASWFGNEKNVLNTTNTRSYRASSEKSAKSPIVTGISGPPGFRRSSATIASDASTPWTSTPSAASGNATRPVPIPSSSARPFPASRASVSAALLGYGRWACISS